VRVWGLRSLNVALPSIPKYSSLAWFLSFLFFLLKLINLLQDAICNSKGCFFGSFYVILLKLILSINSYLNLLHNTVCVD
jgi:hypothetical protein